MKRTVLIDGYNTSLEKGTGIATYGRNLSFAARDMGWSVDVLYDSSASRDDNPLLREIAFFDPPNPKKPWWQVVPGRIARVLAAPLGATGVEVRLTGKVIANEYRGRLPHFDRVWNVPDVFRCAIDYNYIGGRRLGLKIRSRPTVAHWTAPLPMHVRGARNIYTLHDLVPLRLPYTTLHDKRHYYKLISLLLKQADHVVTVSETSRKDIISLFGYPEDKISNTYQSVDIPENIAKRSEQAVCAELQGAYGLRHGEYFLFYGAIEPKKNIGRLIEAYLASNLSTRLVIVGAEAWKSEKELRLLHGGRRADQRKLNNEDIVKDRVLRFDYAPFSLLVSLIRGARAVVFPSLYEGFGLPVLEAMQLGTPVLSSLAGSIPEVAGDAALLVDPYDVRAIAEGLVALDSRPELRADLRERGLKRCLAFSAHNFRNRLQDVYDRLLFPD